jgi:hypothetical protein
VPEHGQLVMDTEGVQAVYYKRPELTTGMRIASGWRPWLIFDSAEDASDEDYDPGTWRMIFVGGHKGGWLSAEDLVPVIVYDPSEDEAR